MRIQVTAADIKKAQIDMEVLERFIERFRYCPIAQAIKRQCPAHADSVKVRLRFVELGKQRAMLSQAAQAFIERFDSGEKVKPAAFNVRGLKC